jgi:uncharacterized peroxidase-related enzyme
MAYIDIIDHPEPGSELRMIYDHLIATRGKLAEVHKIQSLNPPTILSHMNLYKDIMFGGSPLKRYQREMVAVVVSAMNQCDYCVRHHREALNYYWKDDARIDMLLRTPQALDLSEKDKALCQYARDLTVHPELSSQQAVDLLRNAGWDDRAVLDATLVVSYFNFVNRITLALGLRTNDEETKGYHY